MTVITKALTEKKPSDKLEQPLVVAENEANQSTSDPEAQRQKPTRRYYLIPMRRILSIPITTTFLLFLIALMILILGVISGFYVYKQYARTQMHRFCTGWYSIPYDSSSKAAFTGDDIHQDLLADSDLFKSLTRSQAQEALDIQKDIDSDIRSSFKERFEIDLENEHYENIDVPDIRGGRRGRFVHDFNANKTGIIDIDGQSCFVMPLNREKVLQPRNLYDLLQKMYSGEYTVDTQVVRESMRVVTPPITDMSTVGTYIARECQDLPTYMLEKVDSSSVFKRSIPEGVYGQFAGKNIIEFDIVNFNEIKESHHTSPTNGISQK